MLQAHGKLSGGSRRPQLLTAFVALAAVGGLVGALAGTAGATTKPSTSASGGPAKILSVSFSGIQGASKAAPTITVTGTNFGASAPAGTSDNSNPCGNYTANGDVYGSELYFSENKNFVAGYSYSGGVACMGIIVRSWSNSKVVLQFGNAYDTGTHWYLRNGYGYAISIKSGIWGGKVAGLS